MTVWVVYTEWNRGSDLDGSATLEDVYATEAGAKKGQRLAIAGWREEPFNKVPYWDPDTEEENEDWDFDVHIEEREVQP